MEEERYQRIEESSRWLVEASPTGQGPVAKLEAEPGPSREEVDDGREVPACQVAVGGGESEADGMMKTVILLEERVRAIGTRLEQIEVRMGELKREDEEGRRALDGATPGKIQPKPGLATVVYKCKMG
jgi:hypothetical protein